MVRTFVWGWDGLRTKQNIKQKNTFNSVFLFLNHFYKKVEKIIGGEAGIASATSVECVRRPYGLLNNIDTVPPRLCVVHLLVSHYGKWVVRYYFDWMVRIAGLTVPSTSSLTPYCLLCHLRN